MIGDRELSFDHYAAMIRRRVWWIVLPPLLLPALVYLGTLLIPNRYTSTSLVLIDQQEVPETIVKPVITEQLIQRLQMTEQQILSRTRLQALIDRYDLYASEKGKVPMEMLVDQMRQSIVVSTTPPSPSGAPDAKGQEGTIQMSEYERRKGVVPAFYISFTAAKPNIAQAVCTEITSMFVQENLRLRQESTEGTTDFLSNQLEKAKQQLDEEDAKLAAFKSKHLGQLPGEEQSNLSVLNALNTQLDAANQSRSRAVQEKTFAESMLAQQVALSQPTAVESERDLLQKQLSTMQAQLADLQTRYTSEYPDVVRLKADIEQVKKRINSVSASATPKPTPVNQAAAPATSAQIEQLRAQINQLDVTIKQKSAEQERLAKQIRDYESRIQMSPKVEEEYKSLTRGYETALGLYNDLLTKRNQSGMAADLERRQQGEHFRVLDPPDLPTQPSWPVRWKFVLAGFGGGLCMGVGLAFMLEMRDKSVRSDEDVVFYLNLPVLTQIPALRNGSGSERWKVWANDSAEKSIDA